MKLTRRDLIKAGCTVTATALVPQKVDALRIGVAPTSSASNTQRTVINVPNQGQHYLNIAKAFQWQYVDPSIMNSDNYPTSTPSTSWAANPGFPLGYFGSWTWSWTGTASMKYAGPVIVIKSNFGAASDYSSISIISQNNPTLVFQFGWNIQSISQGASNGSGGNLIRINVKIGWLAGGIVGQKVQISGATATGANGTWTIASQDATNTYFDLAGTTWVNNQTSAAGTAVYAPQGATFYILNAGTFSSFANLIICKTPDYTAVGSGNYWDGMGGITGTTTLVGQFKDLMHTGSGLGTPGWLRFMDLTTVQGNFEKDWAQRTPVTALSWPSSDGRWVSSYWVGTLSQTGDAYSCSDPSVSVWGGSDYLDGAIVQCSIITPNVGGLPTLAVGGHPAVPIIGYPPVPLFVTCNSGIGIATIAATGSSYSGTTVTLALSAVLVGSNAVAVGDRIIISGITGTGTDIATLNNGGATPFWTTITGTSGTTIKFTVASGLNITSITGGNVADLTAAAGQSLTFVWTAGGASWLNSGRDYTMTLPTRSSCTNAGTLGYHLEQFVMGINENLFVPGILSGSTLTVCAFATLNGGSYITGTGATTLTFLGAMDGGQYPSVGDSIVVLNLAGSGTNLNSLNGSYTLTSVSYSNSGGSTLVTVGFTATSGYGSITITGGTLFDSTAAQPSPIVSIGRSITQNVTGNAFISSGSGTVWTVSVGGQTGGAGFYNMSAEPVLGSVSGAPRSSAVQVINQSWFYAPSAQAGRFKPTTLPSMFSYSTIGVGALSGKMTFVYNYLLKAWMGINGALGTALPVEAAVQLCNTVGANYWSNILVPSSSYMTSYTNYVAANLNSGLKLGIEYGNENWNLTNPRTFLVSWGAALGWNLNNAAQANLCYAGLRTAQYSPIIRSAWTTAGRASSDFYMLSMGPIFDYGTSAQGNQLDEFQNQGTNLNVTNFPLFGGYGGLGGSGAPPHNFDTYPHRPIDVCDAVGCAPYWESFWWTGEAAWIYGTVAANAPMLQATLDYANGGTTAVYAALVNQFTGNVSRSDGGVQHANVLGVGINTNSSTYYQAVFKGIEAMAAQYDSQRQSGYNKLAILHYEGGPAWSPALNFSNGINSVNAIDIGAIAAQIISLGWNVSAYTQTGTPTVASGTYNSGTGVVVLTLNSAIKDSNAAQIMAQLYIQNGYNILEVSAINAGSMVAGQTLSGSGVTTCTITQFFDNNGTGGNARWVISVGQTVSSQTMYTVTR
jgi:hypothetical protein